MNTGEPRILNGTSIIISALASAHVKQTYRLFISLPRHYADGGDRFPVLYVLDGHALFTLAREIVELHQIVGLLPEMILVGVSYPVDTYMQTAALRGRDFTFDLVPEEVKTAIGYPYGETGGGARFLAFLEAELVPAIEATYRTQPGNRGLLGDSMGADFALRALFRAPDLFQRMAAIAPYIDDDPTGIPAAESRYAQGHRTLPLRLFLGTEGYFLSPEQDKLRAFESFVETLGARDYADFSLTSRAYPGEDHFSVIPVAITHALRALYGQVPTGIDWDEFLS